MKTFSITTLGCRVNHYESEQLATLLRGRGLVEAPSGRADVRIIHTCSVTIQAASKSRQAVRRNTRLTVLPSIPIGGMTQACAGGTNPIAAILANAEISVSDQSSIEKLSLPKPSVPIHPYDAGRSRVVVTGCWATSHPADAANLPGVDAVLGHHQDVNKELSRLLTQWQAEEQSPCAPTSPNRAVELPKLNTASAMPEPDFDEVWMTQKAGTLAGLITSDNEPYLGLDVNGKLECDENSCEEWNEVLGARLTTAAERLASAREGQECPPARGRDGRQECLPHQAYASATGMVTLPQLDARQNGHQRAFLKVQDGCDAHCTYCIIPQLRPRLWSKPVDEAVEETQRLVDVGHVEIVLTGIFLGAYGQPTALRRRQEIPTAKPLGELIDALCTRVRGLGRLRLSSLEPGDLTDELIDVLKRHPQVVPHFHLPLQSGSDALLRRMNRQYGREGFLRMAEQVKAAFDRPAITTDIIVGFPGETPAEFERTVEVVEQVGFIHIHAFSYSLRPKTAAARWTKDAVRGPVVNQRIDRLGEMAAGYSVEFRRQFLGETMEVLVERPCGEDREMAAQAGYQHGRCERYFAVHFEGQSLLPGARARVRVERVTATRTFGTLVEVGR